MYLTRNPNLPEYMFVFSGKKLQDVSVGTTRSTARLGGQLLSPAILHKSEIIEFNSWD